MKPTQAIAVTLILGLVQLGTAGPGAGAGSANASRTTSSADDQREVAWLRDGCETLLKAETEMAPTGDSIDYWGAVCHGYSIAARDYINFLTGSIQAQAKVPMAGCYAEGVSITGRDVARVFVGYVDGNPHALEAPAAAVMFDAVTREWCPDLRSLGDAR